MSQTVSFLAVCFMGTGLYYLTKRLFYSKRSTSLPPGPPGWPVIGNLLQLTSEKLWEDFASLEKKYGDISSINVLGTRYVILNSSTAISEILEKQSIKCSDRPRLVMADLVGLSQGMAFLDYRDRFRQYRKLFSRLFGSKSSTAAFNPIEEEETRRFLRNVLEKPEDLFDHIRYNAGANILKITYGYSVNDRSDPFLGSANKVLHFISMLSKPGTFLVDIIPALRYLPEWFPGTGFHQVAKEYRQVVFNSVRKPHQYAIREMSAGTATPSFSTALLGGGVTPEEEDIIMWASSQIYIGGSNTVVSAIYAFFLAMVMYPEVQAKAHAELDSVVGNERLPCFSDRDSLPYINALCKEIHRWHTVGPLAMPHVAREDIYANGYLIPKGTHIVGNSWAVLHDDSTYPDPDVFRPDRFLGERPQPDPQNVCFGFGRRICPGYHLAEAALFISVAMSLAVFKISNPVVNGVAVTPEYDVFQVGALSYPKPFNCHITARSAKAEALVHG